jgi:chromosome segregation ATPase
MGEQNGHTQDLREKLTNHLADWGAEMARVLRELYEAVASADELRSEQSKADREIRQLADRVAGQAELIETLKEEASDSNRRGTEVLERDREIERLKSDVESKQELIRALRRDAKAIDALKSETREKDDKIGALQGELAAAALRADRLGGEIEAFREQSADEAADEQNELAALTVELDARKAMVTSLRADSQRLHVIEEDLEAKRKIIAQLEGSINSNVETIAGLKRKGDGWRRKYQELKGDSTSTTSMELPAFTNTDIAAMQQLQNDTDKASDRTVAINMRRPLSEARRSSAKRPAGSRSD